MTNKTLEDALRKLIEHAHLYPVDVIDNESAMYDTNLQEACRTATEWIISAQPQGEWVPVEPAEEGIYWFTGTADALDLWPRGAKAFRPITIEDSILILVEGAWCLPYQMLTNLHGVWYGPLTPPRRPEADPTDCPECYGVGQVLGHDRDGYVVERPCLTCKGTGTQRVPQPEAKSE